MWSESAGAQSGSWEVNFLAQWSQPLLAPFFQALVNGNKMIEGMESEG